MNSTRRDILRRFSRGPTDMGGSSKDLRWLLRNGFLERRQPKGIRMYWGAKRRLNRYALTAKGTHALYQLGVRKSRRSPPPINYRLPRFMDQYV